VQQRKKNKKINKKKLKKSYLYASFSRLLQFLLMFFWRSLAINNSFNTNGSKCLKVIDMIRSETEVMRRN